MAFHCETEKQKYKAFEALRVTFVPDDGEPVYLTGGGEEVPGSIMNDLEILQIKMEFMNKIAMAPGTNANFVFDLTGVSGMDEMSLRIMAELEETCRQFGGTLGVSHPNSEIRKMLTDGKIKHQIKIIE